MELLEGATFDLYSGFWTPWLIDQLGTEYGDGLDLPTAFRLRQNSPNPLVLQTGMRYEVPSTGRVTLEVYDLQGRRVRILVDGIHDPGYYLVQWDGRDAMGDDLGSGIYLCLMKACAPGIRRCSASKQMLLLK